MKRFVHILFSLALVVFALTFIACSGEEDSIETLVFADLTWDSVQVHNRVAAFIIENGLGGYEIEFIAADTLVSINGLAQGDIDVDMESWHSSYLDVYDKGIASGDIVDLGKNLPDAPQAWWIPRYMVEGPDAQAPGLKSVADLPEYAELFPDSEDPKKGVIYTGVAGWAQLTIGEEFFAEFGLDEYYNQGIAGSGAALAASMVAAYEKREPWIGYYWAPTAILGRLDMVPLAGSEYDPADVNILVNSSVLERAPDVVQFLKRYSTNINDNNEFLAKMEFEGWDSQETAIWFLQNKEAVWTAWLSDEVTERVKDALADM